MESHKTKNFLFAQSIILFFMYQKLLFVVKLSLYIYLCENVKNTTIFYQYLSKNKK